MSHSKAMNRICHFSRALDNEVAAPAMTEAKGVSGDIFGHVEKAPLDPILGTKVMFLADKDPRKMNLGIGAYRTEEGAPYVLSAVRKADKLVAEDKSLNKEYLSQSGYAPFNDVAPQLLFGKTHKVITEKRVATVQSLSGTGALRVAAEFLHKFFPSAKVFYSNPTWGNHKTILDAAGVQHGAYRYWDASTRGLDIKGMLADLAAFPRGSFILLHACAHNPTGVDPTEEQWKQIAATMQKAGLIPFFDCAYQGFATGNLERDAWAIQYFGTQFDSMLVTQSFAKNMGLYNERIGSLNVVTNTPSKAVDVKSQLEKVIRPMYSNPPSHGAFIVHRIVTDPALYGEWFKEMQQMSARIVDMRAALRKELERLNTPGDWSHITNQIGMFSFTGLSVKQCEQMISKHHVYLLKSGRISMSGINTKNVAYLAAAINDVVRNY